MRRCACIVWVGCVLRVREFSVALAFDPDGRHPAGDLRVDRLLPLPGRRPAGDAALRRARRRDDGHLVVDALRLRRRAPVERAGRGRSSCSSPRRRRSSSSCCRSRSRRRRSAPTRSSRRSLWGRLFFGVPLHFAHPLAFAVAVPAAIARARADGAPDGVELRPLPARERALEPARVPGLDRDRPARSRSRCCPAGCGRSPGARADLGDPGDPRTPRSAAAPSGSRSRMCALLGDRLLRRSRAVVPADLRDGAPGPRDRSR